MAEFYQLELYHSFVAGQEIPDLYDYVNNGVQGGFRWFWESPQIKNGDLATRINLWKDYLQTLNPGIDIAGRTQIIDFPGRNQIDIQTISNQLDNLLQKFNKHPTKTSSKEDRKIAASAGISTQLPSLFKDQYMELLKSHIKNCKSTYEQYCMNVINTIGELRMRKTRTNIDKLGTIDKDILEVLDNSQLINLWLPNLTIKTINPSELYNTSMTNTQQTIIGKPELGEEPYEQEYEYLPQSSTQIYHTEQPAIDDFNDYIDDDSYDDYRVPTFQTI